MRPDHVLRWLARILGTLWAALFFLFFFGEGVFGPTGFVHGGFVLTMPPLDLARILALTLNCIGLLLAWWREVPGVALAALGIAVFLALFPRGFPAWAVLGAILPPVLFLAARACAPRSRR